MRCFIGVFLVGFAGWTGAAEIHVTVEGVNEAKGTLFVGVYNNAAQFRKIPLPQSVKMPVTRTGTVTVVTGQVPAGVYAVAVIWDVNNNGMLDRTKGKLKRPTEPFGFSNNPKLRLKPAEFSQCAFVVREPGGVITIPLRK